MNRPTGGYMEKLYRQNLNLNRGTIIEHREDGPAVGRIVYGDVNGGGRSVGIGWEREGCPRTTLFESRSWECKIVENVVFLTRTASDTIVADAPWPTANKYTIILHK